MSSSSTDPPLIAEHPAVPAAPALQGFEGVRAYGSRLDSSALVLEKLMGATARAGEEGAFELRGDARGGRIAWDAPPATPGRQSAGTVHHIAWGTTDADMPQWIERVRAAGLEVEAGASRAD